MKDEINHLTDGLGIYSDTSQPESVEPSRMERIKLKAVPKTIYENKTEQETLDNKTGYIAGWDDATERQLSTCQQVFDVAMAENQKLIQELHDDNEGLVQDNGEMRKDLAEKDKDIAELKAEKQQMIQALECAFKKYRYQDYYVLQIPELWWQSFKSQHTK
jgi:hypothetical protein